MNFEPQILDYLVTFNLQKFIKCSLTSFISHTIERQGTVFIMMQKTAYTKLERSIAL